MGNGDKGPAVFHAPGGVVVYDKCRGPRPVPLGSPLTRKVASEARVSDDRPGRCWSKPGMSLTHWVEALSGRVSRIGWFLAQK